MIGKAKTQQRLIDNLEDEFVKVCAFTCFSLTLSGGASGLAFSLVSCIHSTKMRIRSRLR